MIMEMKKIHKWNNILFRKNIIINRKMKFIIDKMASTELIDFDLDKTKDFNRVYYEYLEYT